MIAEILSVGTELLMGQIANTDAQYISKRLSELGVTLYRHTTVGDNVGRLKEALAEAFSRADLVITTGDLGPTEDDLTKETVAEYFSLPLEMDEASLAALRAHLEQIGRPMTDNNLKQALFPTGARIMPNACGTAPGCIVEKDGKIAAILPGPPFEMKDMFERQLAPWLSQRSGVHIESRFLRIFGIGESLLETQLQDLFHSDNPTLALYCGPGEVLARVSARANTKEEAAQMMEPLVQEILRRVGSFYYGSGMDASISKAALDLLKSRHETVCFAESCTGGRLAAALIDHSGASDALCESYVTYSDEAKTRILGVSLHTLSAHTCYSAECAIEMAEGARRISGANWSVSVTGLAGPNGGSERTPVGTVYIAVSGAEGTSAKEFHFAGGRDHIRTLAVGHALNMLRLKLSGQ